MNPLRAPIPSTDDETVDASAGEAGADAGWAEFWASRGGEADGDPGDRPTVRPTGDSEMLEGYDLVASGVHRIVPARDASDVESIEAALQKLLAV